VLAASTAKTFDKTVSFHLLLLQRTHSRVLATADHWGVLDANGLWVGLQCVLTIQPIHRKSIDQ
jgi:hypothetical protein